MDRRRKITIQRHHRPSQLKNFGIKYLSIPKSYLREFSSITSLHGVMYLGEPERPLMERVFWFCVMSLVILLCGWQISQLYINWSSSRMIMTIDNNRISIWDLPFPAITFCSDIQLQNVNNRTYKDDIFNKEIEDSINLLCYQYKLDKNVSLKLINSKNLNYILESHKVTCQQILLRLFWLQDEIQSPCDYFQPLMTSYGVCYSLNMIPHQHLYNSNYYKMMSFMNHTQADIIAKNNETMWTPETGYSKNATPFNIPWRVGSDSIDNAVRLIFDLQSTKISDHCPITGTGLTLILHKPVDIPVALQPTAYITGRKMVTISLSAFHVRTSIKIKKWSPKKRNCYYQHEKPLKFFKVYTFHNCEIECRANNTLRECGCNAYYQPRDPDVSVCGTDKHSCIRKSSTIGYSIFDKTLNMSNNMKHCQCLPACTDISYDYESVDFFKNWITNSTQMNVNEDTAMVNIYFGRKSLIDIRKAAVMPLNELLGKIGGLFGLFLGCSIISFFEIFYFFVLRLYFNRRERIHAESKIMPIFVHE